MGFFSRNNPSKSQPTQPVAAQAEPMDAKFRNCWPDLPGKYVQVLQMRWGAVRDELEGRPRPARGDEYHDADAMAGRLAVSWAMSGLASRAVTDPTITPELFFDAVVRGLGPTAELMRQRFHEYVAQFADG